MAWLVSDGRVLASAEVATDRRTRTRGLLGRDGIDGALVIERCRWIHTIGMRFPIDVAYLDADGAVVKTVRMRRGRVGLPVFGARQVVEAAAGAFARWGVGVGCVIEIRGGEPAAPTDTAGVTDASDLATGRTAPRPTRRPGDTSDAARTGTDEHDAPHRPDREPRRLVLLAASR